MTDWDALAEYGRIVDGASGGVLAALGVVVALLARRSHGSDRVLLRALVLLFVAWGAFIAARNLGSYLPPVFAFASILAGTLVLPLAAVVALRFPRRGVDRRDVLHASAVVLAILLARILLAERLSDVRDLAWTSERLGISFLLLLLALRAVREPGTRGAAALASVAFVPFTGLGAGITLLATFARGDPVGPNSYVAVGFIAYVAVLWLVALHRSPTADAPRVRAVAWLLLSMPLLGALFALATSPEHAPFLGIHGVARTAGAAVFAYAILRRDLLGLDVKVRWTLSRGTVAAVFIAVFFVASETAQTFFSGSIGPYVGILAAGLLVFALAPLQRAAERLAGLGGALAGPEVARLAAYREQVEVAWADGVVREKERLLLRRSREHLGVTAEEAERIEEEVLRERPRGGAGPPPSGSL